jgi:hypothetical protein
MTTFQVRKDTELAAALQLVATHLEQRKDFAGRYVAGLRDAATPGNGQGVVAELPFGERAGVAAVARSIAAEGGEHAERLTDFAAGLTASLEIHRVNGGRY